MTVPKRRFSVLSTAIALALGASLLTGAATVSAANAATALPAMPLSTSGSKIVDANGNTVVLQGVNWFGFETQNHAPHGLWTRDYKEMLAQIKANGFNVVRMPFSLQALNSSTTSGIDYANGRNEALQGKTPQQAMDIIIDEAATQGLMVILDNHSQSDDGFMYDLWYGQGGFSEDQWVNTWSTLAARYANKPNVIAADLKNEPHGSATWGTGAATDWRRAAERAGNAVLAANPKLLVMVEGIEGPCVDGNQLDRHWWGGNLECVRTNPVRLNTANKLVYSPHEYGPGVFAQPWFSDPNMASILADRWTKGFGYIADSNTAPILVGEFGAKNVGTDTVEGRWIRQFANYMSGKGTSWTFWAWNPNSGDTGGVLDTDWRTVIPAKIDLLSQLIARKTIDFGATPTTPTASPTSTPTPTPTVTPTTSPTASPTATPTSTPTATVAPGSLNARFIVDSSWNSGWCGKLAVDNRANSPVSIASWSFTLPATSSVNSIWNGTQTRSGNTVTVKAPSWASAPANGTYTDTGICANGTALPANLTVTAVGQSAPSATPTATPTQTPTQSPTQTPTQSPTATATPTSAPSTSLVATWTKDSTWAGGYCRSLNVRNTSTSTVRSWKATFALPAGDTITQSWSGTATRAGNTVTLTPASWALNVAPGATSTNFGFCANGTGEPTNTVVTAP